MSRTHLRSAAAGTVAATSLIFPASAMAAPPSTSSSSKVPVHISFETNASTVSAVDNAHFTIALPGVTPAMTGDTVSTRVDVPAGLDCHAFAASFSAKKVRTFLTPTVSTCSGTEAVVEFPVTAAMVNSHPRLDGWVGTAQRSVTVAAFVTMGNQTASGSGTAVRMTPLGPLASLGVWHQQKVSLASANGLNEVWVGHHQYVAPEGSFVHASLDGDLVDLWTKGTGSMNLWQLDLKTGKVSTNSVAMDSLTASGTSGFVTLTNFPDHTGSHTYSYYSWAGQKVQDFTTIGIGYPGWSFPGFTKDAVVVEALDRDAVEVRLISNTGVLYGSDGISTYSQDPLLTITGVDADGVSYDIRKGAAYGTPDNPLYHCRITASGKSCVSA